MAIKNLIDKLTGKAKREEEARLQLEAEAEEERKRLESAEKRNAAKAKKEAKKAEDKKNDPKAIATANKEPYVTVLSVDINPEDPGAGSFDLDWNDIFVARLVKAGYQGKTDQDIVDNWFRAVCRNVVTETYEQEQADPSNRVSNRRDLGNGRTEIS